MLNYQRVCCLILADIYRGFYNYWKSAANKAIPGLDRLPTVVLPSYVS